MTLPFDEKIVNDGDITPENFQYTNFVGYLNRDGTAIDYSEVGSLDLHYIPTDSKYKFNGIVKLDQRLEILDRVDLSTLQCEDEDAIDKIEGMKLYLKMGSKNNKKKKK